MRSLLKSHGAGGGMSLPQMTRELLLSVAEAGVDIEVCVAAAGRASGAFVDGAEALSIRECMYCFREGYPPRS